MLRKLALALLLGVVALVLIWTLSRLFWGPALIPSSSMEPAFVPGDVIWVHRLAYGTGVSWQGRTLRTWAQPHLGDIIVFNAPASARAWVRGSLVKRVVAQAGDTVQVRKNRLVINGAPLAYTDCHGMGTAQASCTESQGRAAYPVRLGLATARDFGPVTVPAGKVFVMGDNRDGSVDSRFWGGVDLTLIEGKGVGVFSPEPALRASVLDYARHPPRLVLRF